MSMSKMSIGAALLLPPVLMVGAMSGSAFAQANPLEAETQNPSVVETQRWRAIGPCRDPWISKAVSIAKSTGPGPVRTPGRATGQKDSGECNPALYYHAGHWDNYAQLLGSVLHYRVCSGDCVFAPPGLPFTPLGRDPALGQSRVARQPEGQAP